MLLDQSAYHIFIKTGFECPYLLQLLIVLRDLSAVLDVYKRQACDDADAGYNDTSVFSLKGRLGAILGGVRVP